MRPLPRYHTFQGWLYDIRKYRQKRSYQDIDITDKDIAVGAKLHIVAHNKTYEAEPIYMIRQ